MAGPNPEAAAFLAARRSHPARSLALPAPSGEELERLLAAAVRVPDHGRLEPWRLVVLEPPALRRIAAMLPATGARLGLPPEKIDKAQQTWAGAPLVVAVIAVTRPSASIPAIEQLLSAGAVCLSLVNAALAAGWGAVWLTGWAAHDPDFAAAALGTGPDERIAGLIHLGTPTGAPPERPRPDLARLVTRIAG